MKNAKILKRGLLTGLIIFVSIEAIIRLGLLIAHIFVKPLGSFIGGLLAGIMVCIDICRTKFVRGDIAKQILWA